MGANSLPKETELPLGEQAPMLLLVDDTPVTVEIERTYFASVGFRVAVASSALEVEDFVRRHDVNLMMIDVNFARDKGLATAQAAKRASRFPEMKVLVTSILSNQQIRKKAEDSGADEFLVKPAPRPKVLKEIKKLTLQATRHNERVRQDIEVVCKSKNESFKAKSLDISSDGMHMSCEKMDGANFRPEVGTFLEVEIVLGKNEKPLSFSGHVVRHTQEGFGFRFEEIGKTQRRSLDKFLIRFSMEHKASQYYL
jgi:DNA-binding response OmpR family regulator